MVFFARQRSGNQKGAERDQGEEFPVHGKSILRKQMDIIHRVTHRWLTKGHVLLDSESTGALRQHGRRVALFGAVVVADGKGLSCCSR